MARIEILVEEKSMKVVLEAILPRLFQDSNWRLGENYFVREHQGKSDLQKSIPVKMKVFSSFHEPTGIVIVHDQDTSDCKELKRRIVETCSAHGNCNVLVRIACRELESWFLGDLKAISKAYPKFNPERFTNKAKFRNPDKLMASEELKRIVPEFQKVQSAREISHFLVFDGTNRSESFNVFLTGVQRFFDEMASI